jgi:hypothetical protein
MAHRVEDEYIERRRGSCGVDVAYEALLIASYSYIIFLVLAMVLTVWKETSWEYVSIVFLALAATFLVIRSLERDDIGLGEGTAVLLVIVIMSGPLLVRKAIRLFRR